MNDPRDVELGARLDELEVQEHGRGYWESVMAAAAPELAGLRARRRRRRLRLWPPVAAAAATAAIVVVVALSGSGAGVELPAVQPASAAEAIGYTLNVIDQYPGLTGTITTQSVGGLPANQYQYAQHFVVARDGSQRVDERRVEAPQAPKGVKMRDGYDARAHRDQSLLDDSEFFPLPPGEPSEGTHPYWWAEQTHMAPGPPDTPVGAWSLWRLRAYLRSIQGDPRVHFATSSKDGRPVWVLRTSVVELIGSDKGATAVALPVTIVIDAATRLPISYTRSAVPDGDASSGETIVFDIKPLTIAPARDEFIVPVPNAPGVYIERDGPAVGDQGFRRIDDAGPARVRKATFGVAAFPAWVPDGFRVADAATKLDGWTQYPRNAPRTAPLVPILVVSQAFRRGWDQLFVSVRTDSRLHAASHTKVGAKWVRTDTSDPFLPSIEPAVRAEWRLHTVDVRLTAGAFAGATAHVVLEPEHWPHLWVRKGPWVATVAGDLTKTEMIRVAESLGPWNAANGE